MKKVLKAKAVRVRIDRDVTHFVREWRKYREMSVTELGRLANVSASMISQLETGKANYTQVTLESLAKALAVHPALLLWTDPTASALAWSALLKGWRDFGALDEVEPGLADIAITCNVEAAVKTLVEMKRSREPKKGFWAV